MDGAVAQRVGQRLVHETMLVEQREPVETRAGHGHLEVVAAAGAVLDAKFGCIGKCALEECLHRLGRHAAMLARNGRYPAASARARSLSSGDGAPADGARPLHIFEPRYRELVGECVDEEREFGLLLGDEDGLREIGTRAVVVEVVDRFPDGRLNIVVEGRERFRLVELTEGRSFATGEVRPVADADSVSEREQRDSVGRLFPLASVVEVRAGLKRRGGCSRSRRLATSRVCFQIWPPSSPPNSPRSSPPAASPFWHDSITAYSDFTSSRAGAASAPRLLGCRVVGGIACAVISRAPRPRVTKLNVRQAAAAAMTTLAPSHSLHHLEDDLTQQLERTARRCERGREVVVRFRLGELRRLGG
jgi:hypothetical protein